MKRSTEMPAHQPASATAAATGAVGDAVEGDSLGLTDATGLADQAHRELDALMSTTPPAQRCLGELLARTAAEAPDRVFLRAGEERLTYREVEDLTRLLAAGLESRGVGSGDRVLLMLPNDSSFVLAWFACVRLGAVQVPINTAYRGLLLDHIVSNSQARTAIVAPQHLPLFPDAGTPGAQIETMICTGEVVGEERVHHLTELQSAEPASSLPAVSATDPAAILYSSGTTGPSKGIILSHQYFWFHAHRLRLHTDIGPEDQLYTCLPLFHANAQVLTVMAALVAGAGVVLDERFSASRFWDRLRETRATRFNYIGGMIPILMKQPPSEQDRQHDVRFGIGAAAPSDQIRDFEDRFGLQLVESYGQTENCVALANPIHAARIGSVGLPLCGFDVEVLDDDDNPVPAGDQGELVFRPRYPHIMMEGYHAMPEEMVEATRNLWFHTGDLVRRDDDGYFYFVDRKKDAIRRRGENISAYEVELVVNSHPAVLESAAFAVPSEVGEDEVMIAVVARDGEELDALDLIRHCEPRMPYFAVPRFVDIRSDLPKTPTHRVEKYRLRADGVRPTTWDREAVGYVLKR